MVASLQSQGHEVGLGGHHREGLHLILGWMVEPEVNVLEVQEV